MNSSGKLTDALHQASVVADRLLGLGEQMEQAFIWDSLDLATADSATTEAWWRASVSFPEEFTYEDDGRAHPQNLDRA